MTTQKEINLLSRAIIGYAIDVHKELGPGLLESIYEKCLAREFELRMLKKPKGILINFNCCNLFKEGQKTLVNELFAVLSKN